LIEDIFELIYELTTSNLC